MRPQSVMRTDGRAPCSGNAEDRGRGPPASPARTPCTWGRWTQWWELVFRPARRLCVSHRARTQCRGPEVPWATAARPPALRWPPRHGPPKCAGPGLRVVTCDHGALRVFAEQSAFQDHGDARHSGDSNIFLSGDRSFPRTFRFLIPRLLEGSMPVPSEAALVSVSDLLSVNSLNIFFMCLRSLPGVFNILF